MKRSIALLLLTFTAATAHAGSFGGPPPFTNGSPLQSGTDGVYQAVASGTNVTGLFTWQIQNGVQTTGQTNNSWIFFVDGNIISGTTSANISQDKVAGVLDSGIGSGLPTAEDGTLTLPLAFLVSGSGGSGQFTGKINLNSPIAYFSGKGTLSGTPARTDQIIFISTPGASGGVTYGGVTVTPVVIPASTLGEIPFKFRGSRLTTTVSTTTTTQ